MFNDFDFIYISHIHGDHCSYKTMSKLDKNIPVIIHKFPRKHLKNNIEKMGFNVIELDHNVRTHLKNNLYINILAADDCNPQLCGKFFGCGFPNEKFGTQQIDTLCVIDNTKEVIVNTNDCPYELAQTSALKIKESYGKIDLLMCGYSGASPYPHCFEFSDQEKKIEADAKKKKMLTWGKNYIGLFKPKYFMPFAGKYTLTGKLVDLNSMRGEPELEDAYEYFISNIDQEKHKAIILNTNGIFDITTGSQSKKYIPVNLKEKNEYIQNVLSKVKFDYESEESPDNEKIIQMLPKAYENFEKQRNQSGFRSETKILIELSEDEIISLSCDGSGYEILNEQESKKIQKVFRMKMDKRLFYWLLEGPVKANWDVAETGSHIKYQRIPNVYERALHYCLTSLHA